ncbi:MAG: hypothetical protein JST04_12005 [Bdellovibrionales bacterium]|nr:hypothetical protein [Bdellovibrionales bacterium]
MRNAAFVAGILAFTVSSAHARVDHATFRLRPVPTPSAVPDANACASDLVTNPSKYTSVPPMAGIGTYFADRYSPAMDRYADAEEALVSKTLANLKSLASDAASVDAGPDIRVMGLFLMIGDVLSSHARDLFLAPPADQPSLLRVNRDALAGYLPGVARSESDVLADALETLYKMPAIYVLNDSRMTRFDYLVSYLVGLAARQGIRASREAILADVGTQGVAWLAQLENRIGPTEGSGAMRVALGKLAARYPLNSADRRAFVKFYPQWVMQLIILDGPVRKVLEKSSLTFVDVVRVTELEKRLQAAVGVAGERRTALRKKVMDRCRSYAGAALAHFPTTAQLEKARTLIEAVRSEAILAAPEYIGSPYTEISQKRLAEVNFDLPESQDAESTILLDVFSESRKEIDRASKAIDGNSVKERAMALLEVAGDFLGGGGASVSYGTTQDEPLYLAGLRGQCGELLQSYSPFELDAYLNGTIYVGWQSVFYPEYGVATYAHEIGHAASFIGQTTADGWVLPTFAMACSQKNHAYLRSNLPGDGDKRFAQEDFADAFSATVTSRMKAKLGTEVAGLLGTMLALKNPMGDRLVPAELESSNPSDPHSGILGREILYRLGLGEKLPASCESILLPPMNYQDGDYKTLQSCSVR